MLDLGIKQPSRGMEREHGEGGGAWDFLENS